MPPCISEFLYDLRLKQIARTRAWATNDKLLLQLEADAAMEDFVGYGMIRLA